ncbi:MAG TPA: DUF222 domain-containing protein, partial [Acidimicrobiia bacterium]|nr:DUF222 domain-containing protein [Acidimicrobiia bacterium]
MSQLRSALEEVASVDDQALSTEDLAADITELVHVGQMVEVLIVRKTKSLADRGGHHDLGYSSPTNLLVDVGRMSPWRARQTVSYTQSAEKAPVAYQAWVDGRLSSDQVRWLFAAAEAIPDDYPQAEERLVEIVEGLDVLDTRRAIAYWRETVDGPGELTTEKQQERRGLSASWTMGGMLKVDGTLTTLAGEAFLAAVDANNPPRREDDHRTPRHRRHDALENLCRDWLDNGTTPTVGGEKPHIILHTDIPALQGLAGGLHKTESGHIIDVDLLRMVACDCSVTRIIFGPEGEVLDVGRKTRVWSTAQRR